MPYPILAISAPNLSSKRKEQILKLDALEVINLLATNKLTCYELMTITLDKIEETNIFVNAIIKIRDRSELLDEARDADRVPFESRGILHGIPFCVKDCVDVSGFATSHGYYAPLHDEFLVSREDSIAVSRIKKEGAIIIGKTNVPEFAVGSHTFNKVYGVTRNPYHLTKSSGGSSGGSAVALSTRMLLLGHGTDMMGSLRNPAGWNNLYSLRPSGGLLPYDTSILPLMMSTEGPLARSPLDLALLFGCMTDNSDNSNGMSSPSIIPKNPSFKDRQSPIKIGWLNDWNGSYQLESNQISFLCENALRILSASAGCQITHVQNPPFSADDLWESWTTLRSYYLYKTLPNYKNLKKEALWEVKRGQNITDEQLQKALTIAKQWSDCCNDNLFQQYDVLALPSAQMFSFDSNLHYPKFIANGTIHHLDTYHRWMEIYVPVSLAMLPCVTIPVGFKRNDDHDLPMGMQLFGPKGSDLDLITLAQGYHVATGNLPRTYPPEI